MNGDRISWSVTKPSTVGDIHDPALQFALAEGPSVSRQKVINNLPGTIDFCPLVRRTARIEEYQQAKLDQRAREISGRTPPDILARGSFSITQ